MRVDGGTLYPQVETQLPSFIQNDHSNFAKFIEKYYEFLELNLITFNDLDLNEDKPIQESANVTHTVTVATGNNSYSNNANKFYVGGSVSADVTLDTGVTYIFNQADSTNEGHYLRISTTPDGFHTASGAEYSNSDIITVYGTPGTAGAQTVVTVSPDLADSYLYYFCNNHSGMGGKITISANTPYISLESSNSTVSNYVDFENPNRQGDQFLSGETIEGANSGAKGIVRGKYSTTQVYVEETNDGSFQLGETITGLSSRATANVTSYNRQPLNASRNVKHFQDIDKAPEGYVELFRKEFLQGVPKNIVADKTKVLKNIKDFYRAKGNENSYKYIFRLLYQKEDVSFYYPSTDILRLSDGRWTLDKTVKIDFDNANNFNSFEGRTVKGATSNVTALVERTQTYQIGAAVISELYLSNIDANNAAYNAPAGEDYTSFAANEELKTTTVDGDGNYATANTTGILSSVSIDGGGSNYSVGDELQVIGGGGKDAGVKVSSVSDATIAAFNIIDAGDGYSAGDTVSFINEGTGGSGGAARIESIIPTANVFLDSSIIDTFKADQIGASAYASPLNTKNANDHIYSNSTTTFTATKGSGTTPKKGDLLFYAERGGFLSEDGNNIIAENGNEFDREGNVTINNYDPDSAIYGTVVHVSGTAVTYALGSVNLDDVTGIKTIRNFTNGLTVDIYDTLRDGTGSAKAANSYNAVMSDTGNNMAFGNTPVANTATTSFGAVSFTEAQIGGIRTIQVLSSGQGYKSIPQVSVANTRIESYQNAPQKLGSNSIFLTLGSAVANDFSGNTIIKNSTNTAQGLVLDFIDKPVAANVASVYPVVSTGNTVLRVQMQTSNNFTGSDTITAYTNDGTATPIGIGDFSTANITTSTTTGTYTQASHGFSAGHKVTISGVTTGITADDNIFNNTYTIATVPNTNTFTITLTGDPTTASVTAAKTRRVVTGNTAASNAVYANTGRAGNNAVIAIASIAIGAIQSLSIYNFGANYTSLPTINASAVGDGNATLTAKLGAIAEYDGYFDGTQGLLSGQGKLEDNYYYQDFSYVIKTDVDVTSYRDKITDLVHPAGLAMFGEVAMYQSGDASMYSSGARNENTLQANTTLVAGTSGVSQYNFHEITIATQNTVSSNTQINSTSFLPILYLDSAPIDNRLEFPALEYDLVLEHDDAGIGLEGSGDTIGYEDDDTLVLDDGYSRIQSEEYYDSLTLEDGYNLELEDGSLVTFYSLILEDDTGDRLLMEEDVDVYGVEVTAIALESSGSVGLQVSNYLLSEPSVESVKIVSEDPHDVFNINSEVSHDEYYIILEDTSGDNLILETGFAFIGFDTSVDPPNLLVLEIDEVEYSTNFKVVERSAYEGFSIPKIQFPEASSGAVHIDMGFGSQLRLETDIFANIKLEYTAFDNLITEGGGSLVAENGDNFVFVDDENLKLVEGETGELLKEDGGIILLEDQPDPETEGFDFDLLMLESTEGAFPVYLAMEDSMQDEIDSLHEIQINPIAYDKDDSPVPILVDPTDDTPDQIWHTEAGDRFIYEAPLYSKASAIVKHGPIETPWGTGKTSAYNVPVAGAINATMGEAFELLAEDDKRFVTESSGVLRSFVSESGDRFVLEHDSNLGLGDTSSGEDGYVYALISDVYDRQPSITGTDTKFSEEFNAPIVLEDFSDENRTTQTATYIELQDATNDGDLILIEGGDRVFVPIVLETATGDGNLALENTDAYASRKLLYTEYLDVIIEEEVIAQEEDFKMLMEADTGVVSQTLISESGTDTLVLEHIVGDYGTEPNPLENISQGDSYIEDFVANLALEDDGSIVLEERTPTGLGTIFLLENGDRLLDEVSGSNLDTNTAFILNEDSYVETYASGQLISLNSTSDSLHQVELTGDVIFPYGVNINGKIQFEGEYSGDTATVSSQASDYLLEVDFGNIALEDGYHVLNEDGDKTKRNASDSTARNYKIEYGIYTQDSVVGDTRYMKVEEGTTDCNNIGRNYMFVINGFKSTDGSPAGDITLEEIEERIGNDIILEDGGMVLVEDGELTQDPNALLLEDESTYLTFEENNSILMESDVGYTNKLLNFESAKHRIEYIANNTFMKFSNETHLFNDMSIRANHLEQVPA